MIIRSVCWAQKFSNGRCCERRYGHPGLHRTRWNSLEETFASTYFSEGEIMNFRSQYMNDPEPPPRCLARKGDGRRCLLEAGHEGLHRSISRSALRNNEFGLDQTDGCKFHTATIGATAGAPGSGSASGRDYGVSAMGPTPTLKDPTASRTMGLTGDYPGKSMGYPPLASPGVGDLFPARIAIQVLRARDAITDSRNEEWKNTPSASAWRELIEISKQTISNWVVGDSSTSVLPVDLRMAVMILDTRDKMPRSAVVTPTPAGESWNEIVSYASFVIKEWASPSKPIQVKDEKETPVPTLSQPLGRCDRMKMPHPRHSHCIRWSPLF